LRSLIFASAVDSTLCPLSPIIIIITIIIIIIIIIIIVTIIIKTENCIKRLYFPGLTTQEFNQI